MSPLFWAAILMALAMGLVVLEVFVPSGGVLGFLAGGSVLASVITAFYAGMEVGAVFLACAVIGGPIILSAAVRIWPHTPLGRRILIARPEHPDDVLPDTEYRRELKRLVGRRGVTDCKLLPSGAIRIDNRIYDASTEGESVAQNTPVVVLRLQGVRVMVRPLSDQEKAASSDAPPDNDPLNQPFDDFGLDDFESPLS